MSDTRKCTSEGDRRDFKPLCKDCKYHYQVHLFGGVVHYCELEDLGSKEVYEVPYRSNTAR